mmetsp:Transcript_73292/g.214909  ORF Transcript_73292/g.214909 Transcript_73292/m.214909 type:complete len:201 (+) Transcript_73292:1281-1883(+)
MERISNPGSMAPELYVPIVQPTYQRAVMQHRQDIHISPSQLDSQCHSTFPKKDFRTCATLAATAQHVLNLPLRQPSDTSIVLVHFFLIVITFPRRLLECDNHALCSCQCCSVSCCISSGHFFGRQVLYEFGLLWWRSRCNVCSANEHNGELRLRRAKSKRIRNHYPIFECTLPSPFAHELLSLCWHTGQGMDLLFKGISR